MRKVGVLCVAWICFGAAPVSAVQLAGQCLDSELAPWRPIEGSHLGPGAPQGPPSETNDSLFYAFPPRLELTSVALPRGENWRQVRVPTNALQVPKPYRSWRTAGDTLVIALSDDFTGVIGSLTPTSDGWVGELRMRSDNLGSQLYSRGVVLRPVDCESEPPIPASADAPAPRAIPSAAGPALTLGEPVPEGYEARRVRAGFWLADFRTAGYWSGSDSVFVRTNPDGLVSDIVVRYPAGFDASILEAGLIREHGPGRPDPSVPTWWNRTTRAYLSLGQRPSVRLIDPRMRYY